MPVVPRAARDCLSEPPPLCAGTTRFPRQARLNGAADFQPVFRRCRHRLHNRWLTLLAIPNRQDHPRLGLAISRKVARTAVARNRIKRAVRERFRHRQAELGGYDIVVLGRNDVAGLTGHKLQEAIDTLLTRLIKTCAGQSSN